MADVRPFRGLRFDRARVPELWRVLCPPYDVVSPAERQALTQLSPYNMAHIELPDPSLGAARYQEAARTLERWRAEGVLQRDELAGFYLYEVTFALGGEERTRRSLVAAVRIEPWGAGQILAHEQTMAGPKADRLELLEATKANISPVWLLHRAGSAPLAEAWARTSGQTPLASARLDDGTEHRLWDVSDPELVAALREDFAERRLVMADGHHRYETALRYRDELAAKQSLHPDHPACFVLAHLSSEDDPGLVILPTHRLVRGLGQLDQAELENELGLDWHGEYFPVWEDAPPEQLKALLEQMHAKSQIAPTVGLYGPDPTIFSILTLRNRDLMEQRAPARSAAWRGLDVALLDEGIIKPLLERAGVEREQAISYERDPYVALQAVRRGEQQIALFLNPTQADQVIEVAEAGDRMPEKSTYFYPKPPTGLVLRDIAS